MNRKTALAIGVVVLLTVSSVVAGYYWCRSNQEDTSWVEDVNHMLENATPYPNGTDYGNPNVMLSYCRTYLYENGTSQLIEYGNIGKENLISTSLNNLLVKANIRLKNVSDDFLAKVLTSDKVLFITYRFSTMQYGGQQRFSSGYFIVKDNLNDSLLGTIITVEVGKHGLSLWAISR